MKVDMLMTEVAILLAASCCRACGCTKMDHASLTRTDESQITNTIIESTSYKQKLFYIQHF